MKSETVILPLVWREKQRAIHVELVAGGLSGEAWIRHFQEKNIILNDCVIGLLHILQPTADRIEIVIIPENFFSSGFEEKDIFAEAEKRGLVQPTIEAACLFREYLSNEDLWRMGLRWVSFMRRPDSTSHPDFLFIEGDKKTSMETRWYPIDCFKSGGGFVFMSAKGKPCSN